MTRSACLNAIYELAKRDERVVFIGSDLSPNTLQDFRRDFPNRFYMEGVQEQNIIGMAAGLALEGFIPYVNTIATFLTRRCYEQIAIDICAHNLPVRLIANGGGLVYAPLGPTHCAIEDMAIMRALPNMVIYNPAHAREMTEIMMDSNQYLNPMYFRLGKDSDPEWMPLVFHHNEISTIQLVSTGCMTSRMMDIGRILIGKGIYPEALHFPRIKPFPSEELLKKLSRKKLIVTTEEGIINGGLGSAVLECLADNNIQIPIKRFGLPDAFPHHYGEREDLLETYGLTPEKMAAEIMKCL